MADRMTRREMTDALKEAGVQVPCSATVAQVRVLFDDWTNREVGRPGNNEVEAEAEVCDRNEAEDRESEVRLVHQQAVDMQANGIDEQLATLRRQRDLFLLQREVKMLQQEVQPPDHVNTANEVTMIDSMVGKFSGDDSYDIRKWFSDLEDTFAVLRCSKERKSMHARRLLDGTAKLFSRSLSAITYDELKGELLDEFGHTHTLLEVYEELKNRKLKPTESLHRYVIEMQIIAGRANIPECDVVDAIIRGIGDKSHLATMLYQATNLRQLKVQLERYEKLKPKPTVVEVQKAQLTSTSRQYQLPALSGKQPPSAKPGASEARSDNPRCYNCQRFGHFQAQCTQPRRPFGACFTCGEAGHRSQACPRKRPDQSNTVGAVMSSNPDYEANLVEAINALELVSVVFIDVQGKRTETRRLYSLFDSGSPTSFVSRSIVPFVTNDKPKASEYRGMGNVHLGVYDRVSCAVKFGNQTIIHRFHVVSDDALVSMPMLIGRDLLKKFSIHLCKLPKRYYSKDRLNELKETLICNNEVLKNSAFDLYNLRGSCPNCDFKRNVIVRGDTEGGDLAVSGLGEDLVLGGKSTLHVDSGLWNGEDEIVMKVEAIELVNPKRIADHLVKVFEHEAVASVFSTEKENSPTVDINDGLSNDQKHRLLSVINASYVNPSIKVQAERVDTEMRLKLIDETPFHFRPRRLSYAERIEIQKIIEELLQKGIIRYSNSPYASATVLVRKKDGKGRLCIDYRLLNKRTERDNFPMPVIEDCLDSLSDKKFFTALDLKQGFHQIPMHRDSIKYTSFVIPNGQYEYVMMPFGLKNAPAVFQRFLFGILKDLIYSGKVVVFMDDVMIASETFEAHIETVGEVLKRMYSKGLELKLSKCKFGYSEINYLGYTINASGVRPSDAHLEAIQAFPQPTNQKQIQQCVGLFSYFRKFVPSFSTIARPLTNLLKENVPFEFTPDCVKAFETLKSKLISGPVLSLYNPHRETELHTDASKVGFGAVLMQKQIDGKFHPVAYFSKVASESESKLHSFELETLAIVYALERFKPHLGIPFTVITDCNALAQSIEKKQVNPRIARWVFLFENFNFTVKHRSGVTMGHVDALSRCHLVAPNEMQELDVIIQITQNRDDKISNLRSKLEKGTVVHFELRDGLVFKRDLDSLQLYVPKEMEENIIRLMHEKVGHQSVDKTSAQIRKHYWFPKMKGKVKRYIQNCLKCITYNPTPHKTDSNLHNIPKHSIPFDTLHVDHFGPLPAVRSARKHLLVVVDAFTKYVKLYAVKTTGAREVCACLQRYFDYYSRPRRIISDRGSCFTSREFEEFIAKNNVEHVKIAVASAQANGQVERVNRVLKTMLAKVTDPISHEDWVGRLADVEFAINNSMHASTKQSPSILLFGVDQRGRIVDELTEFIQDKLEAGNRDLVEARATASESIKRSQDYNLNYFSKHSFPAKLFQVGDNVVMKNVDTPVGTNKKLIAKYRGPYIVSKKLPNDRYVLRDIENHQVTQIPYDGVVESNRLRRWIAPSEQH